MGQCVYFTKQGSLMLWLVYANGTAQSRASCMIICLNIVSAAINSNISSSRQHNEYKIVLILLLGGVCIKARCCVHP